MWPLLCALLCLAPLGAWAGPSCHMEVAGGGISYLGFLGRRSGAPVLFQSAWDGRGRLLACSVRGEPWLIRRYRAACARRLPGDLFAPAWKPARRRALDALARHGAACSGAESWEAGRPRGRRAAGDDRDPPARRRSRRGWTMPGTLWCGAGDSAGSGAELGIFQGPDLCCREHDQCAEQLSALEYNYGIRNYRLHTVSHCDCDARFKQCLLGLNDTISNIIGITFFDLLEMPCFVLEESEACVEWHWWGGCKRYGPVALARLVQQSQYEYSPPLGETTRPAPRPPGKGWKHSKPGRKHRRKKMKGPRLDNGVQGSQSPREAQKPGTAPLTLNQPSPPAPARSCGCYRRLDQCEFKIAPHEVKYQLHNPDSRTLFHCNCTRRLARFLRRTKGPNEVEEEVLSDFISTACFVLEPPADCANGEEQQPE
uniref:phospholipase A2 n=1 Tax=Pelusios castaneus TaxID=367368 RepID=A0A8C8RCQ1_9SAUR